MTTIQVTVDEITEDQQGMEIATLIAGDGAMLTVPLELLPDTAREGDVLRLKLEFDAEETARRQDAISERQRRLFG